MNGPLEGIKVLDLSRVLAGPFCAMLLGDMGAEVVKVERRGKGDDSREIPPYVAGESLYYLVMNRNKRGVTLNFRHPEAPRLLKGLVEHADVLIENFRAGTMEKIGCGYEALREVNPRLIMVRISGFGQEGPYSDLPCYDDIAIALSGLMDMTGQPDGPPTLPGSYFIDYGTGLNAALGTVAALRARDQTGTGQMIDVALLDTAMSFLVSHVPEYLLLGKQTSRIGSRDKFGALCNIFRSKDNRWVYIAVNTDAVFASLTKVMGQPDLVHDSRFATFDARAANLDEAEAVIGRWMETQLADEAVKALQQEEVTCAKVSTIGEFIRNPQVRYRQDIIELEHPTAGKVPVQGPTIRFSGTPQSVRRPPPLLGQHNEEVYGSWLGLKPDEISRLRAEGVI